MERIQAIADANAMLDPHVLRKLFLEAVELLAQYEMSTIKNLTDCGVYLLAEFEGGCLQIKKRNGLSCSAKR